MKQFKSFVHNKCCPSLSLFLMYKIATSSHFVNYSLPRPWNYWLVSPMWNFCVPIIWRDYTQNRPLKCSRDASLEQWIIVESLLEPPKFILGSKINYWNVECKPDHLVGRCTRFRLKRTLWLERTARNETPQQTAHFVSPTILASYHASPTKEIYLLVQMPTIWYHACDHETC